MIRFHCLPQVYKHIDFCICSILITGRSCLKHTIFRVKNVFPQIQNIEALGLALQFLRFCLQWLSLLILIKNASSREYTLYHTVCSHIVQTYNTFLFLLAYSKKSLSLVGIPFCFTMQECLSQKADWYSGFLGQTSG